MKFGYTGVTRGALGLMIFSILKKFTIAWDLLKLTER